MYAVLCPESQLMGHTILPRRMSSVGFLYLYYRKQKFELGDIFPFFMMFWTDKFQTLRNNLKPLKHKD